MNRKKLTLKREALSDLSPSDLSAIVGGVFSDSCVTGTRVVCATVDDCITDDCVTAITTIIHIEITGDRCRT